MRPIQRQHATRSPTSTRPRLPAASAVLAALALACGGEPPEVLGGFRLEMSQQEVMDTAYARPGFRCRLMASRPKVTLCSGPTDQGQVEAMVRGDSAAWITLEVARNADDPARATRRFARSFGDPAWRDRPFPPRSDPPEGYHTLWLNEDSTRSIAMVCRGRELAPPCNARLSRTSPARVEAQLDSLLNIRR